MREIKSDFTDVRNIQENRFSSVFAILIMLKEIIWMHSFIISVRYSYAYLVAPKCCTIGEVINANMKCGPGNHTFNPEYWIWPDQKDQLNDADEIGLIIGNPCRFGRYRLEPHVDSEDEFHLLPNGSLYVPYHRPDLLWPSEYCLETFYVDTETEPVILPLVCFQSASKTIGHKQKTDNNLASLPTGSFASAILQISVLIMFVTHKENKTVTLKHLISISHCFSSCIVFLLLIIIDMTHADITPETCILVCWVIQAFYVATVLLTNAFMYETFLYIKNIHSSGCLLSSSSRNMKFQRYLCYIAAIVLITLFFTLVMDVAPVIPIVYVKWTSWFKIYCLTRHDTMVYVNCCGLMLLSFTSNLILLCWCIKHSNQQMDADYLQLDVISGRDNTLDSHMVSFAVKLEQKLEMKQCYLFFTPALNCVSEIICWSWDDWNWSWIITDACNLLQGLAIVFIYVISRNKIKNNHNLSAVNQVTNFDNVACTLV